MGRWKPDAARRLARAALHLFEERGYEHTTVADIAAAAELTESTFFRHFSDKRDVLFAGFSVVEQQVAQLIREAPQEAGPVEALQAAMAWLCEQFQANPALVRQRLGVVSASPELMERELIRHAALATVMAQTMSQRGHSHDESHLLAQTAMSTVRLALQDWGGTPGALYPVYLEKLDALRRALTIKSS